MSMGEMGNGNDDKTTSRGQLVNCNEKGNSVLVLLARKVEEKKQ